jgi:hypothetical protein
VPGKTEVSRRRQRLCQAKEDRRLQSCGLFGEQARQIRICLCRVRSPNEPMKTEAYFVIPRLARPGATFWGNSNCITLCTCKTLNRTLSNTVWARDRGIQNSLKLKEHWIPRSSRGMTVVCDSGSPVPGSSSRTLKPGDDGGETPDQSLSRT